MSDSVGSSLSAKAIYYSPIGKYYGGSGFLMKVTGSTTPSLFKIGYKMEANRTMSGFVVSFTGLELLTTSNKQEQINQYCFSDVSGTVQDFRQESLSWFSLFGADKLYFGNGTVVTLEEFA